MFVSIPRESVIKPRVFLARFQGVQKQNIGLKWIKRFNYFRIPETTEIKGNTKTNLEARQTSTK